MIKDEELIVVHEGKQYVVLKPFCSILKALYLGLPVTYIKASKVPYIPLDKAIWYCDIRKQYSPNAALHEQLQMELKQCHAAFEQDKNRPEVDDDDDDEDIVDD